jgi:hypothetical protein
VRPRDAVRRSDRLGRVGLTGWVCGAHLHSQIQRTCSSWWCQSIAASFRGLGNPRDGDAVKSNNCPIPDRDEDRVKDAADNCPSVANRGQADADGDGKGNACDADDDGDGMRNGVDNCVTEPNPQQTDGDGDGLGDACDDFTAGRDGPLGGTADGGAAHVPGSCPGVDGVRLEDLDGDGLGDVCDDDVDGDAVDNARDNCPGVPNADQTDVCSGRVADQAQGVVGGCAAAGGPRPAPPAALLALALALGVTRARRRTRRGDVLWRSRLGIASGWRQIRRPRWPAGKRAARRGR